VIEVEGLRVVAVDAVAAVKAVACRSVFELYLVDTYST